MAKKKITICGVDPGLAAGAAVLIEKDGGKILDAQRLYSQMNKVSRSELPGDANFTDTVIRAGAIAEKLLDFVEKSEPRLVVIESFVDFGSNARRTNKAGGSFFAKDRWKVPLVIGYFSSELMRRGATVMYTNPSILRQYADEIALLTGKHEKDIVSPGDTALTNDHMIKAWCHADWAARHWDEVKDALPALSLPPVKMTK